jgi:hypothetical protein
MKWFKHDCDASEDSRIKKLKHKFGMEGYGVFFNTLELMGRKMENDILSFGYLPEDWDSESLEIEFGLSSDKIQTMFDYMCQIGLFEKKEDKLFNSKLVTRCDDYTNRILRLKQFSGIKSEHTSNHVQTKSDNVHPRLDKIRLDKIRIKNNNVLVKEKSKLEDLTDDVISEIAETYKVSVGFVTLQREKLKNYCSSKGKVYKDYKAALRNFVLSDMQKEVEGRKNDRPNIVFIDPK